MKTFLVIAHDADDEDRPARRAAARPDHLERIVPFVASGQIVAGGAMLNNDDDPIGSAFFATFETQDALQEWLDADPYVLNRVWIKFEITPVRLAVRDGQIIA